MSMACVCVYLQELLGHTLAGPCVSVHVPRYVHPCVCIHLIDCGVLVRTLVSLLKNFGFRE